MIQQKLYQEYSLQYTTTTKRKIRKTRKTLQMQLRDYTSLILSIITERFLSLFPSNLFDIFFLIDRQQVFTNKRYHGCVTSYNNLETVPFFFQHIFQLGLKNIKIHFYKTIRCIAHIRIEIFE